MGTSGSLTLHSPLLKPISGFRLLSWIFQRQIVPHLLILSALAICPFLLLLEYANEYVWIGLTNTWYVINV